MLFKLFLVVGKNGSTWINSCKCDSWLVLIEGTNQANRIPEISEITTITWQIKQTNVDCRELLGSRCILKWFAGKANIWCCNLDFAKDKSSPASFTSCGAAVLISFTTLESRASVALWSFLPISWWSSMLHWFWLSRSMTKSIQFSTKST